MLKAIAATLLMAAPVHAQMPGAARAWPEIAPLDQTFVVADAHLAVIRTFVRDLRGRAVYLFICRTADDERVPDVNYAGELDCRLIPAELGEVETNLLVESPALAPWYSRGRMFARELIGDCGRYPEYGRSRNFRLRGLRLTMTFSDVTLRAPRADGSPRAKSYRLRLQVVPDPAARLRIAEESGYLDPHRAVPERSCAVVRKGREWLPVRRR